MLLFKKFIKPYALPSSFTSQKIQRKQFLSLMAAVFTFGLGTVALDAEAAKRMDSGKSMGTQRQTTADKAPTATV